MSVENTRTRTRTALPMAAGDFGQLTTLQQGMVLIFAKCQPGSPPADTARYAVADLQYLKEIVTHKNLQGIVSAGDCAKIVQLADIELARRAGIRTASRSGGPLEYLPPGPPPRDALFTGIFGQPRTSESLNAVKKFLRHATLRPPGDPLAALPPDVVLEIRQFEKIATLVRDEILMGDDIGKARAAVLLGNPDSLAGMYLDMSYDAALHCLKTRMGQAQRGFIGHSDRDTKLIAEPALRMLTGKEGFTFDKKARHTLRFAISLRIAQILSLPGADKLSMKEIADRVAFSFRKPEYLTQIDFPLELAFP